MKHFNIKKLFIIAMVLLCSVNASAHDFEVDGIYYNIISVNDLTVAVTYKGNSYDEISNEYSGEVIIPETIAYKSKVLKVTSIGDDAFSDCSGLTSIEIPNSVTSIGNYAFYNCDGLTSIEIPNRVTSIGNKAFYNCRSLKDLRIEDGEGTLSLGYNSYDSGGGEGLFYDCPLETLYLGRNLSYKTSFDYGYSPFYKKTTLTSVTIGSSVTSIGDYVFDGCTGLKSITIPSSVTSIGDCAFLGCSGLTSIEIPNRVTSIGSSAFYNCDGLTNVVIGNSVTSIGYSAFYYCESLKKVEFRCAKINTWFNGTSIEEVVIGNSVTSIIGGAFKNCSSLTNIHLLGKTPPSIVSNTFAESQYATLTIYVPQGALDAYQAAYVWKDFWDIREEGTTEIPEEEVKKCATPVITYNNSGLDITTETDGAEIHTDITCSDANSYNGDRIDLSATYSITTYATKSGYLNSDTATATLCWIAVSGSSEENSIIEVEAMPVLITCNNGTINISGGKDGAEVVVYTTSGVAVGNATITNGNASISTELAMGEIAVVNIAGKGIKIVMQ